MRAAWPFLLASLGLVACKHQDKTDTGKEDTSSPYVYHDTAPWEDTSSDTFPPVDTSSGETGVEDSSVPQETGDTGEPGPELDALALYPAELTVQVGASFQLRLVAWLDGDAFDVELAEAGAGDTGAADSGLDDSGAADTGLAGPEEFPVFASSDPSVAEVSPDGTVTALAVGDTTLSASYGGLVAESLLHVTEDGLHVTVVDWDSGDPLEGVSLSLDGGSTVVTSDASGEALLETSDPGGLYLDAWLDGYVPLTLVGSVARDIVLPLQSEDSYEAPGVTVQGSVDFSGVDPGSYTDIGVGLAVPSWWGSPLAFDIEEMVGEDRTVSIYGIDVKLPGNVFIDGYVEDYEATARPGDFAIWSLAGPVPLTDLTSGLSGAGDVLALLVDHLPDFSYELSSTYSGASGDTVQVDIAPCDEFSDSLVVEVPPLPLGFTGSEDVLVLALAALPGELYAVRGLGVGPAGSIAVRMVEDAAVPGATGTWFLALAQVEGIGSGGPVVYTAAPLEDDGLVAFPDFQLPASIGPFSGATRELSLSADERASLVQVVLESNSGHRLFLFPSGEWSGTVSSPYSFHYGRTSWSLDAYETRVGTFEDFVSTGRWSEEDLAPELETVSHAGGSYTG